MAQDLGREPDRNAWERQRSSFGDAADMYERSRPSYPDEAVDWLLPAGARRVLDLGAGTGKLTRLLVARGLDVVAVEPLAGMRAEFARVLPDVPVLAGSAEDLPIDAGAVDVVVAAQAWHWVDPGPASREVARVLRPGGGLGLVWNLRDPCVGWVGELERIMGDAAEGHGAGDMEPPEVTAPFGPLERKDVAWSAPVTPDGVVELVASRSYVITMDADGRTALLDEVRRLLVTHPDTAGRRRVDLPYVARCYRTSLG